MLTSYKDSKRYFSATHLEFESLAEFCPTLKDTMSELGFSLREESIVESSDPHSSRAHAHVFSFHLAQDPHSFHVRVWFRTEGVLDLTWFGFVPDDQALDEYSKTDEVSHVRISVQFGRYSYCYRLDLRKDTATDPYDPFQGTFHAYQVLNPLIDYIRDSYCKHYGAPPLLSFDSPSKP
jgi:hypothetical protein